MIATISVEKKDGEAWLPFTSISIEVPFARAKFNFVLEVTAKVSAMLAKMSATEGVYRIGWDDGALIEWNGVTPKILVPVTFKDDKERDTYQEVIEASKESN